MFTDQASPIIGSGTHPSLHPNCYHYYSLISLLFIDIITIITIQITIHCKVDFKIIYPHTHTHTHT